MAPGIMTPIRLPLIGVVSPHKCFLLILLLNVLLCSLLELFFQRRHQPIYPPYGLQRTFVTIEAGDGRRLGNILFSYAALYGIAQQNNMTALMPDDFRLKDVFGISAVLSSQILGTKDIFFTYWEYGRRASAYDIRTTRIGSHRHMHLFGYYQSWKYFSAADRELRNELSFLPSIRQVANGFLKYNVPEKWREIEFVRVGIHVRRGDIVQEYFTKYGYTTAGKDYFEKAIRFFKRKHKHIQFVVCSDDILWSKANLPPEQGMVFSERHDDVTDMAILSLCDHVIVSVGSFGWWAAWLANGTTVYYDGWPKEYSKLEYHITKGDYFPPHWIPIV